MTRGDRGTRGNHMTQADFDTLKARLVLELADRRDKELRRHQQAVGEVHTLAHQAVLEAVDEGQAYEAISLYTQALALLRGVPLRETSPSEVAA